MKKILLLAVATFYSVLLIAQTFEIRAVNKGNGIVGVEIRLATGTSLTTANNVFTDITFGIKWLSSYQVNLLDNLTTGYRIQKATIGRQEKGSFHYQSFFAEPTPLALPVDFVAGQWKEILAVDNTRHGTVPTGTFQIVEPNFDLSTDPDLGIGVLSTNSISYYTPAINGSAIGVILPVKLTRFEAIPVNKTIQVQWATASEYNNKGFEIERSDAVPTSFNKIGWLNGWGNSSSTHDYAFIDKNVVEKIKYYYRLKQVDIDGNYQYSDIKSAILNNSINEAIQIKPNPTNKVLQVYFGDRVEKGKVVLKIIDVKGSVLLKRDDYIDTGKMLNIDVSGLANGQYFIVIEKDTTLLYSKAFQKM